MDACAGGGGGGKGAYRLIWSVAGVLNVLALPLLCFIHSPVRIYVLTCKCDCVVCMKRIRFLLARRC